MDNSENNYIGLPDDQHEETFLVDMPNSKKQDKITIEEKEQKKVQIHKRENNSGMGEQAPYSIAKKFNWGACLFNWVWGLRYKKWALLTIPALVFVPYGLIICVIISLWAGINGNQWAWEEIEYKDEKDFHKTQKQWVKAWGIFAICIFAIFMPLIFEFIKQPEEADFSIQDHQLLNSIELTIPSEYFEQTDITDNHAEFITSDKSIIYWLRPDNKLANSNKKYIETRFEKNKKDLGDKFVLYPDLKRLTEISSNIKNLELEAKCKNDVCIDTWLYQKCNRGYCIINPQTRKYYKVRTKENIIPKARSLKNKW